MMAWRKGVCLAASVALATSMLAGCGGQSGSDDGEEQGSAQSQTESTQTANPRYALNNVPLRAEASADADKLTGISVGAEVDLLGEDGDWANVTYDGTTGWCMSDFLTDDKEAAVEVQQAMAEQQQEAIEEALEKAGDKASDGERSVISKTEVPDCDNPEHGHYEIIYSDGTVETEEY